MVSHDHQAHHHFDMAGNERRVFLAMVLTGSFVVAEIIGGLISGSLALLADAGHMLTDTAALALAWVAFRIRHRRPDPRRTYGYHRFQVLAAFINGITLVAIVGWIVIEAVQRLLEPTEVLGSVMLTVAGLGLVVNLASFLMLRAGARENLNIRGATIHVLGDMLGSVATIVAALIILGTGWTPIDPLLSILVAGLIFRSAWDLVKRAAHILLEGTPDWLDVGELRSQLRAALPVVEDVHHVHAWSLTAEHTLLTLHVDVLAGTDHEQALNAVKAFLNDRFGIAHSTVQIEQGRCADDLKAAITSKHCH